jgi:hypothetical protein
MHPAALDDDALLRDCDETRTRRSGPGGQHRNKVETAVVLVHRPTGIVAEASERRSQAENRLVACRRLRLRLALDHREPAAARPSDTWASRARGGRLQVSPDHRDYATLVAEALDHLVAADHRLADAAGLLGVTTTQLVGLFRKSSAAWTAVNAYRAAAGRPRVV